MPADMTTPSQEEEVMDGSGIRADEGAVPSRPQLYSLEGKLLGHLVLWLSSLRMVFGSHLC